MRTSHRQIRKRILDAKSKISDEEFFSSRAYNGYLTDLAEAATKRYKRPLRVRVVADHDDDTVAFTDYHGIYINACNHITWSLPTRLLRSMSLEGFNAHECGHNLFTDNRIWNSYFSKLEKGKFYPKMPDGLDSIVNYLMRKYGVNVPLRTQGWINEKLTSVTIENGKCEHLRYMRAKGAQCSQRFFDCMSELIHNVCAETEG